MVFIEGNNSTNPELYKLIAALKSGPKEVGYLEKNLGFGRKTCRQLVEKYGQKYHIGMLDIERKYMENGKKRCEWYFMEKDSELVVDLALSFLKSK